MVNNHYLRNNKLALFKSEHYKQSRNGCDSHNSEIPLIYIHAIM